MTPNNRQAFALLMLGLGETYGEPVSDARMEIYFRALDDVDLAAIQAAANVHVRTQKFFPRPSELRDAIAGTADDRAELAWTALLRLVRSTGYMREPEWPDPVLRRAACDLYGSWRALCERLPADGPEFLGAAKQFKAAYVAYAKRDERQGALPDTQESARLRLVSLKDELQKRGLPTGDLA